MEKIKSKVFKKILKANRSRLNACFALARQTNIRLRAEVFLHYLAFIIDPILLKNEAENYETLEKLTITLYEKILELCTKEFLGKEGKYPGLEDSLILMINSFPRLLIKNTDNFISGITNAILNIYTAIGLKYKNWINKLLVFKNQSPSLPQLFDYGLAAAWTCGLAHYRESALKIMQKMDMETLFNLFNITPVSENKHSRQFKKKLLSSPWINPRDLLQGTESQENIAVKTVSNFIGYNGHFIKPPCVYNIKDYFVLSDKTNHYRLYADIFGYSLIREQVNTEDLKKSSLNLLFGLTEPGIVNHKDKQYKLPAHYHLPVLSQAAIGNTLVFTSSLSHRVFIVGIKQ